MGDDDILIKSFLETSGFDAGADIIMGGLMRIGEIAVDAMMQAGAAVSDFVADSFAGAMEAEQAMAQIEQVIKSTGGAAGMTADDVAELGDKFAYLAGGSDDAVLAIEEMGLRMGNITAEQMPDFIQTSLDLAAATGVDAAAGARLLAQAYDDPVSAIARFKKQGILVSDALTEQIKKMQDAGDTAGAYALLMDRVGEATGGAAAAQMDTTAGRIETFKNTIGEAGEEIFGAFLPALSTLFDNVLAPALPTITNVATAIGNLVGAFTSAQTPMDAVNSALAGLPSVLLAAGMPLDMVNLITGQLGAAFAALPATLTSIQVAMQPVIDAAMLLYNAFLTNLPAMQLMFTNMMASIQIAWETYGPPLIANVAAILTQLAEFWSEHGATIMGIVSFAFNIIVQTISGALLLATTAINIALNTLNAIFDTFALIFQGKWGEAFTVWTTMISENFNMAIEAFSTFFNNILTSVGTNLGEFKSTWSQIFNDIGTLVQVIFDGILGKITSVFDGIKGAIGTVIGEFDKLKASIGNLKLPDWLTPGSPTPLELGLLGISDALKTVSISAPGMAAGAANSVTNSVTKQYNYSPTYGGAPASPQRDFSIMQVMWG
jgi:phage-related protein